MPERVGEFGCTKYANKFSIQAKKQHYYFESIPHKLSTYEK